MARPMPLPSGREDRTGGEEAVAGFGGDSGTVVFELELPGIRGPDCADADPAGAVHRVDGVGGEVLEDEEGEVGGAVVEGRTVFGGQFPSKARGDAGVGKAAAAGFVEDLGRGDLESGEALLVAEHADDVVDHRAHASGGVGGVAGVAAVRDRVLEGGEGIPQAMDEVGGDGADRGGPGGEGKFAVGLFQTVGPVGEESVGQGQMTEVEGEDGGERRADQDEGDGDLAEEVGVESCVLGGEIAAVEGDEGVADVLGRLVGAERQPDFETWGRRILESDDGLGGQRQETIGWSECVGGAEEGGEKSAFGAVGLDGFDAGEVGCDGGSDDGGERVIARGRVFRVVELLLDQCGEDAGIAGGELVAELVAEGNADGGHGDAEEDERSQDGEGARREAEAVLRGEWRFHGGGRRRGAGQKSTSSPACQVLAW
jgi:hypothetical protein